MQSANETEMNGNVKVLSLAFRTLFYFFIFAPLFTVCIFLSNPYFAMKMSYDLGFEKNAYTYAKIYLQRQEKNRDVSQFSYDHRYVNALIYSIELGDKLLSKDNAQRLKTDIRRYCSIKDIKKRNEMLDEYYRNTSSSMQVAVYSYESYIAVLHARACSLVPDNEEIYLLRTNEISSSALTNQLEDFDFFLKADLFDFAVLLNQVAEYQKGEIEDEDLISGIENKFSEFVSASLNYNTDDLFRLFLLKSALTIIETNIQKSGVWEQTVEEKSLFEYYYQVLLYNYITK